MLEDSETMEKLALDITGTFQKVSAGPGARWNYLATLKGPCATISPRLIPMKDQKYCTSVKCANTLGPTASRPPWTAMPEDAGNPTEIDRRN